MDNEHSGGEQEQLSLSLPHFSDSKPEESESQEARGGLGRSKGIIRIFEYSGMSRTSVDLKIVV